MVKRMKEGESTADYAHRMYRAAKQRPNETPDEFEARRQRLKVKWEQAKTVQQPAGAPMVQDAAPAPPAEPPPDLAVRTDFAGSNPMSSTESTTVSASEDGDPPKLTMEEARHQYRERGDKEWYLHGLPPATFEPFPCDLRMKFLHHDATKDAEDKTDSSWFTNTEVDLSRVAAGVLVAGVEYSPIGDLERLLTEQIKKLETSLGTFVADPEKIEVENMKLRMPQLQPPNMPAKGDGVRPRVVNRTVVVPHPNMPNTLLYFTPTDPEKVLGGAKLSFDARDDEVYHSVEIFYDAFALRPVLRKKPRDADGPEATWVIAPNLDEEQARSVLDPWSWPQSLVDDHFERGKDPMPRAMIELIVRKGFAGCGEWADVLEATVCDSWKEGHAFNSALGRWKNDPTYASKRDDSNRELNGMLQGLVGSMEALLKPLPGQADSSDHPNLEVMARHLFEIQEPIVLEWLKVPAEEKDEENGVEGHDEYCLEWSAISCDEEEQLATVRTEIRALFFGAGLLGKESFVTPKHDCINEVRKRLCEPGFPTRLDANKYLLPFRDGVYELRTGVFRPLRPTDYVTRSIPYDFAAVQKYLATSNLTTTDPTGDKAKVIAMLKRIYPQVNEESNKHDVFEYVMSSLFAQMLCGDQSLTAEGHKFVNHMGNTRNGKTLVQAQLLSVFGDADDTSGAPGFFASPAMSLLTTREEANRPAPDLLQINQARCVCIDEASNDQKNPVQEGNMKKWSGNGKQKARKCHDRNLQEVSFHCAGIHAFGQFGLQVGADEALDQRRRTIKYEAFFARNAAARAEMEAKGHRKDYIFDADPALDSDEQRRKWAPVFMALLIDRWERYHLGRGDDVATWPDATPPGPGKWPPMPPLVQEWTDAEKGGGEENPYREWVAEHVVLCGSPGAKCQGWSKDGKWTCKHFLLFTENIKKAMNSADPGLFNKGKGNNGVPGQIKKLEAATGRHHIGKLSETEMKRVGAASRHNKVFPAMQLRSDMGLTSSTIGSV